MFVRAEPLSLAGLLSSGSASSFQRFRSHSGIFDASLAGRPQEDPLDGKPLELETDFGKAIATSSNGGPNSRYRLNEDSFFLGDDGNSLFAGVIDGTNGGQGPNAGSGHTAASVANETFLRTISRHAPLSKAFTEVHRRIAETPSAGFATAAAARIDRDLWITLMAVGDSKAAVFRGGRLLKDGVTRVQSWVAEEIRAGRLTPEQIHTHPRINVVLDALGSRKGGIAGEVSIEGRIGDVIVLGTDGFWDLVSEYEVARLSRRLEPAELQRKLFRLALRRHNAPNAYDLRFARRHRLKMTTKRGDGDNVTCAVVVLKTRP